MKNTIYMGSASEKEVKAVGSNVVSVNAILPDAEGKIEVRAENINANGGNVQEVLTTLRNDLDDLGDQVLDIQAVVNSLKSGTILDGKTLTNSIIKNTLTVQGDTNIGEAFTVTFVNGVATIASNNGIDVLSKMNFAKTPTVEGDKAFNELASDELVSKKQVAQAISEVSGNHFDKWILSGVPQNLTLTETLQPVYMPATTRFPNLPPESMEPNADGTGIKFKTAGIIHFKRKVSLAGSNVGNIYYQARINGQALEELNAQAVSISENTMSYTVEFYWEVSANQEMTIWANSVDGNVPLNYRGVTTIVEYL